MAANGNQLNGKQLNEQFGSGFSPVKSITGFNDPSLNKPSAPVKNAGADVQEQQIQAAISFDAATGALKLVSASDGEGLWIPYLGNGEGGPGKKGWGTYSKLVTDASWVGTGPFSGCYVAAFQGAGFRFAHLITEASGHPCATVDQQIAAIEDASKAALYQKWPMQGVALGLAFFMKVDGSWVRRFAWVGPGGNVMQMNATSTAL
ncbi:MAG: hypothetical protein JO319_11090 [Acidobacteriaceae bacterium]|nr:hypothetical protein [Acidobacteriaceae bacterium]